MKQESRGNDFEGDGGERAQGDAALVALRFAGSGGALPYGDDGNYQVAGCSRLDPGGVAVQRDFGFRVSLGDVGDGNSIRRFA